ncbi:hypothetical protein [Neolewinella litorea]|uniref:Uncharacterized protein n=1 Tax=Neolewinella litorea TaxID=2562452 RepID=A0A4V3XJU9_9BACT|nr:hypothetical protein [Neolewinella litorea]THH34533.1 hypothetical protein E4021_17695 [Neolewinella litorea]
MDNERMEELRVLSEKAALSSALAKESIERYTILHGNIANAVTKPLVMKIAEEADEQIKTAVDATVKAAISNLQMYLDLKK